MMRGAVAFSGILVMGCSPDFENFAQLCRKEARLVVHDNVRWGSYVDGLNADHQKYGDRARNGNPYLIFFGTDGFDQSNDFAKGNDRSRNGRPYRNDWYVAQNGRPVATIINYDLKWNGFDSMQSVSCVHNHPEAYGVRVAPSATSKRVS